MTDVKGFVETHSETVDALFRRIEGLQAALTARIREIAEIPSPTFQEARRAEYLERVLPEAGLKDVTRLPKGSVMGFTQSKRSPDTLLLAAHIDNVFSLDTDLITRLEGSRLHGPGTGDNAANLAAIITLAEIIRDLGISLDRNVAFCGNVCEEGNGNMAGMEEVVDFLGDRLAVAIAVDGRMPNILNRSLAIRRYAISARGPGGHAWTDFGTPSAVHEVSRMVAEIVRIEVPQEPKTTFNVGTIKGGNGINAVAQDCTAQVELRSLETEHMEALEREFLRIVDEIPAAGIRVEAKVTGERPAGIQSPESDLVQTVMSTARYLGLEPELGAASSDAALPASRGIPALAMGTYKGDGVHTLEEYVDTDSLTTGLKWLALTVLLIR
jgi:acetylornithine deacetylase/succinyl-diaminopimelate desuccinylase-like protein